MTSCCQKNIPHEFLINIFVDKIRTVETLQRKGLQTAHHIMNGLHPFLLSVLIHNVLKCPFILVCLFLLIFEHTVRLWKQV